MVRIALDCRSVFPGMGGIGRYAAALAGTLPLTYKGAEFHFLVTERKEGPPLSEAQNACERRFVCGMIDERWEQLELPGELAGIGADLYHSTCFSLPVAGGAKRTVATVHDVIFRRHPELVDEKLRVYLDKWTAVALDLADAVITVSEFSKGEICKLYGARPEKIRVVYNGVDPRFGQKPSAKKSREVAGRLKLPQRYVLYVGALEEKKNVARLLAAWGQVTEQDSARGWKLVLAGGTGGKRGSFQETAEAERVKDSTLFAGYVPDEDLPALVANAGLFVYPSLYEGFGLPVLEAMAAGVPVVTSQTSSLGEVAGDAARLVDPESVDEMAEAMSELLGDKKLAQGLRKKGLSRAAEFTLERCARGTLAVYRGVLGEGR